MMNPLSKEDLDGMRRERLGNLANRIDVPLEMAQRCHNGESVIIEYLDGLVSIRCAICHRDVDTIIVASRLDQSLLPKRNTVKNVAKPATMERA